MGYSTSTKIGWMFELEQTDIDVPSEKVMLKDEITGELFPFGNNKFNPLTGNKLIPFTGSDMKKRNVMWVIYEDLKKDKYYNPEYTKFVLANYHNKFMLDVDDDPDGSSFVAILPETISGSKQEAEEYFKDLIDVLQKHNIPFKGLVYGVLTYIS